MRKRVLWSFKTEDGENARLTLRANKKILAIEKQTEIGETESCESCGQLTETKSKIWKEVGSVTLRDQTIIPNQFRI